MALKKVNPKINLKINLAVFGKINQRILMYVISPIIGIAIGLIIGIVILALTKPTAAQINAQKTETPVILGKEILSLPSYTDLKTRQLFGKLPIEIGTTGKEEPFKTIKK
jgi:phosphate/sulfate permease